MRRLFEPNTRGIGRPPGPPTCDAVPERLIDGTPSEFRAKWGSGMRQGARSNRLSSCLRN
jgi:hypothetical protein